MKVLPSRHLRSPLPMRIALPVLATAGAIVFAASDKAHSGPDACNIAGNIATCQGNQSNGITNQGGAPDFTIPPVDTLNINSLTQAITPGPNLNGIQFIDGGAATGFTINSDTGVFGITTTGTGEGISGRETGAGSVTVRSTGNITAGDEGIEVDENDAGDFLLTSTGDIVSGDAGIDSSEDDDGNFVIMSMGNINSAEEGFDVFERGTGNFTITSTGNIVSMGADGLAAVESGDGNFTITSIGNIVAMDHGFDAFEADDGDFTIISIGNVTEISDGSIRDHAFDVFEADNGSFLLKSTGDISTFDEDSQGFQAREFDTGDFTFFSTGNITTRGDDAEAIELRETGDGNLTATSMGNIVTMGNNSIALKALEEDNGNLSVTSIGNITTLGTSAHGIQARDTGKDTILVASDGTILVSGGNADAVQVQFDVAGGMSVVDLSGGAVQGGAGTGAGVNFIGPAGSANVLNNSASNLFSLSGLAIKGGDSNETVNNSGTVSGAVDLGVGINTFNNRVGGTFNAGATVIVGTGNSVNNAGVFSPGGSGGVQTTVLTGNFVQTGTGILLTNVNPSAGTADRTNLTGTASLAGSVQINLVNPVRGPQTVTILSATGGTTNNGLALLPSSPALQASLSFPNATDVSLSYSIDFSAGGLNPNQTSSANALNSAFDKGSGGLAPILNALLNNVFTIGNYQNALDQLSPEAILNTETSNLFSAEGFVENLFSCRLAGDNHTALSEGSCLWARPKGTFFQRDSNTHTIGFEDTSGGLSVGGQFSLSSNWYAGFALGYERGSLDTDTRVESDSDRYNVGASLKYQNGAYLLAAAVSGGFADYNTTRPISFGGLNVAAASDHTINHVSAQARAAYLFEYGSWFAKPLIDVKVTYQTRDGINESGAGAANLVVASGDETYISVTPALEIGGDFALTETSILRPYLRAGVSYYANSEQELSARFANAPAGTNGFAVTSEFDDVFADVAAGATALFDNGSTLGLSYDGLISTDTQQHGISLKGTIAF